MADDIRIHVDDAAVQRAIDDLTKRQMTAAVKKGVSLATTEARKDARAKAPKRTGTLRSSIMKTTRARQGLAYGKVYVKPSGFYGKFVENGTVNMAAEPFMKPAEDAVTPKVPGYIEQAIAAAIAKAGLK